MLAEEKGKNSKKAERKINFKPQVYVITLSQGEQKSNWKFFSKRLAKTNPYLNIQSFL